MDREPSSQIADVTLARPIDPPLAAPPFRALFEAELSYVFHTLHRLGVRHADLEDVTHEVFVAVHRALPDYDPARPLRPWLFGFAFRFASDYRRRARFSREVPREPAVEIADEAPRADEQIEAEQARQMVIDALQALPLERRAVLVMHDIDGCAMPEIADTLSIPLNTAYSRLRIARADFKAAVKRVRLRRGERGEP